MARPKIEEVDYHQFTRRLSKAVNNGQRLEQSDQPAWDDYVAHYGVNEVAMSSWGRSKFESVDAVIISAGDWRGYYVYSTDEEAVLKWIEPDA